MKITLALFVLLIIFSFNTFAQDFPYTSLEGHTDSVTQIVFSPDGATLASMSSGQNNPLMGHCYQVHIYTRFLDISSYIYSDSV